MKRFEELVRAGATALPRLAVEPRGLERLAEALSRLLQEAADAAGRRPRKNARGTPWWNDQCAGAAAELRAMRRIYPTGHGREVQTARRELRRAVRRAKRHFWQTVLEGAESNQDIYKIMRWSRKPSRSGPRLYRKARGRGRHPGPLGPRGAGPRRTLDCSVTLADAACACTSTGNTSPGIDGITVRMLRRVWNHIGEAVRGLYEGCLHLGYHPACFRAAEVVMIPKPACLGKGLERLIARRLAWAAITQRVIHSQHAGALPKRSALDLALALLHDAETALTEGKVATLITMDIQGAFDTVLRNRLLLRLREQGWPTNLVRWAGCFMEQRSARIRLEDITTPTTPLTCGLPQGSPASPILFLLYTVPIYSIGEPNSRFGYADDVATLIRGRSYRRRPPGPRAPRKEPQQDLRWLGVWYDRKLSFRTHVEKWAAKAMTAAGFLQNLSNTRRGILPVDTACGHGLRPPILLYGAHVWYPGALRPVWGTARLVPSRITYLKNRIQLTLNVAMRAIARSETRRGPSTLLDERHPLTPRMSILPTPGRELMKRHGMRAPRAAQKQHASRLLRLHQMTAHAPRPRLLPPAPPQPDPTGGVDKTQAARDFNSWLRVCPEDTLIVYTDGSQSEDGACGYGYSVWLGPSEVTYGSGRVLLAEVYDAEVEGALEGFERHSRGPQDPGPAVPDSRLP
ncbi:reverse transcriptase (RNA-dependent DNA polymerase) domain-containing protein [Hirsutella rhossiliensis]|uniref:Reverse transcriptase (RNA-dependent DNA polymerase) domain-containing protein n=1 Tax=Hirsutella rhossiliensis TaxID=111463 RepID=A0A9P8MP07_9HYPO|nr:reverse transcriptase (RNA-dependent DNA polymerase) domain-containing protein [Hirsutella rhossiliensis]KAH0957536.1 reverse transcriptase (RNA-dependent DNA polymerase) domain-containing protein [Hirsutella rhossiliensis]